MLGDKIEHAMRLGPKLFTAASNTQVVAAFLVLLASGCSVISYPDSNLVSQVDDRSSSICLGRPIGKVPVVYNNDNLVVRATIDGHPAWFIVDSGSERTIVTPWTAENFELQRQVGQRTRTNGVSGSFAADGAIIKDLDIGPLKVNALATAVAPLPRFASYSGGVIGVLGSDVLAKFGVAYDLPAAEIRFYDGEGCPTPLDATLYDLVAVNRNDAGIATLPVVVDGATIPALFDTGATVSGLNLEGALRAGVTPMSASQDFAEQARGFGGSTINVYFHTFQEVQIGNEIRRDVPITVGPFATSFDGNAARMLLGLDYLKTHTAILPKGSQYIYIKAARVSPGTVILLHRY